LLEELDPSVRFAQLRGLVTGSRHGATSAVLAVGDPEPAVQAGFGDAEVLRDLADGGLALAGYGDHVAAELFGKCFRHGKHPFTVRSDARRSDVNQTRGSLGALVEE
jgi:hypothetical protein